MRRFLTPYNSLLQMSLTKDSVQSALLPSKRLVFNLPKIIFQQDNSQVDDNESSSADASPSSVGPNSTEKLHINHFLSDSEPSPNKNCDGEDVFPQEMYRRIEAFFDSEDLCVINPRNYLKNPEIKAPTVTLSCPKVKGGLIFNFDCELNDEAEIQAPAFLVRRNISATIKSSTPDLLASPVPGKLSKFSLSIPAKLAV